MAWICDEWMCGMTLIFDAIDGTFGGTPRPASPYSKCVTAYQQFITQTENGVLQPFPQGISQYSTLARDGLLSLDIETWPVNWTLLQGALKVARQQQPAVRLSFFGSGAVSGTMINQGIAGTPSAFTSAETIDDSDAARATMALCDFCSPGLYLNSTQNVQEFLAMAGYTIAESRRYGKPVYAEICPFYGDNDKLIPEADWSGVIWNLSGICDGLIIWAHIDSAWNENAPWWQALKGMG